MWNALSEAVLFLSRQFGCLSNARRHSTGKLTRRGMFKSAALPIAGAFALPSLAAAVQDTSTPYQRPRLKITDIRTAQVRVHGPQTHIRIYTDQGLYGHGEATDAAVGTDALVSQFRRFLIGQDPLNVDAI